MERFSQSVRRFPEEHLPPRYKAWYWRRLFPITMVFFGLWTIIAIWWHIPSPYALRNVLLLGGIPGHWSLATYISIWSGIVLGFAYCIIMDKVDGRFREKVHQERGELPEEVRQALDLTGSPEEEG